MEAERKCFRLVGGVLVERRVQDVLPAVQTNMEGVRYIGHLRSSLGHITHL